MCLVAFDTVLLLLQPFTLMSGCLVNKAFRNVAANYNFHSSCQPHNALRPRKSPLSYAFRSIPIFYLRSDFTMLNISQPFAPCYDPFLLPKLINFLVVSRSLSAPLAELIIDMAFSVRSIHHQRNRRHTARSTNLHALRILRRWNFN